MKTGEISLPEFDLDHDDVFRYVWALVDSCAGANVAKKSQLPNWTKVDAPEISLTVANGDVMPNSNAGSVTSFTRNGEAATRNFDEAPVGMPVLAITELAKEGELCSEVFFPGKGWNHC